MLTLPKTSKEELHASCANESVNQIWQAVEAREASGADAVLDKHGQGLIAWKTLRVIADIDVTSSVIPYQCFSDLSLGISME